MLIVQAEAEATFIMLAVCHCWLLSWSLLLLLLLLAGHMWKQQLKNATQTMGVRVCVCVALLG